jgi:hypothetical protein
LSKVSSGASVQRDKTSRANQVSPARPRASGDLHTCISAASFWSPEQIGSESAWLEHAPFAFWIVEALRPKLVIELGTAGGYSYFSLCQAVQWLGLDTRCFAVDTWRGDDHAGFYGEEVFRHVENHNRRRYSAFSTLVRSTFDEAVGHFQDGTIDLLHIDGRHGYADVKHDFSTWQPKLSRRAVVLFHDTNVRETDFGVWKYWAELTAIYPHFEFFHGHGLGVLGVGKHLPDKVRTLLVAGSEGETATEIQNIYARLGSAFTAQLTVQQLEVLVARQREDIASRAAEQTRLTDAVARHIDETAQLRAALEQRVSELMEAKNYEERLLREKIAHALHEKTSEAMRLRRELSQLQEVRGRTIQLIRELDEQSRENRIIKGSMAFRLVQIMQKYAKKLPWVAIQLRRCIPVLLGITAASTPSDPKEVLSTEREIIIASGLFDTEWYLEKNADVRASGLDAVTHYLKYGAQEGRSPSPSFDGNLYLSNNPDAADARMNPLLHYVMCCISEGRTLEAPPARVGRISKVCHPS